MTHRPGHFLAGLCLAAAAMAGGCNPPPPGDVYKKLLDAESKAAALTAENNDLRRTIAAQQEHIDRLLALGDKRLGMIFHVERIDLGRYTGGVDLDNDGVDDGVRVFLEPIDQYGTTLKAAGEIAVELYDLAAPPPDNQVCKCRWSVQQAAKEWASGLFGDHYSLTCPWTDSQPRHDEITVRVTFVDYLTGRSFSTQKACKIKLAVASGPASRPAGAEAPAPAAGPSTQPVK